MKKCDTYIFFIVYIFFFNEYSFLHGFYSLEHWDNDANINKKGNFQNDDQEQNTNSGESYFTERDYSSGNQSKLTKTI